MRTNKRYPLQIIKEPITTAQGLRVIGSASLRLAL